MKKTIVSAFLIFGSILTFAQTTYKCFESKNGAIKLSMKLVNGKGVSVKYKGQKESISLLNVNEHKSMGVYMIAYQEIYNGEIIGNYDYRNEGKGYETLEYYNDKGKSYEFKMTKQSKNECY